MKSKLEYRIPARSFLKISILAVTPLAVAVVSSLVIGIVYISALIVLWDPILEVVRHGCQELWTDITSMEITLSLLNNRHLDDITFRCVVGCMGMMGIVAFIGWFPLLMRAIWSWTGIYPADQDVSEGLVFFLPFVLSILVICITKLYHEQMPVGLPSSLITTCLVCLSPYGLLFFLISAIIVGVVFFFLPMVLASFIVVIVCMAISKLIIVAHSFARKSRNHLQRHMDAGHA